MSAHSRMYCSSKRCRPSAQCRCFSIFMAQMKIKREPKKESIGNVEPHRSCWRARIWQNNKNQRGPSRRFYDEAMLDLMMVRSGFPVRRLCESRMPRHVYLEQHHNSYRVCVFVGSEIWRTQWRRTSAEARRDLDVFRCKRRLGLSFARNAASIWCTVAVDLSIVRAMYCFQ